MQPGVDREQAQPVLQTVLTNFRREQTAMLHGRNLRDRIEQFINTRVHLRSAANGPSGLRQDFERALWVLAALADAGVAHRMRERRQLAGGARHLA